jgi:hypothetical protein
MTATTSATTPGPPGGLSLMGSNRTSITLAWQRPAHDGGSPVLGYQVRRQCGTAG